MGLIKRKAISKLKTVTTSSKKTADCCCWSKYMPQVFLSSFGGAGAQFFDNNGQPLAGGKIYTYEAGTTTPLPTYTTSTGITAHANPIILDSAGRVPGGEIWLAAGVSYKFALYTSLDILIGTYDNVASVAAGAALLANFTGDGSQTNFTLLSAPINEDATNIFINGVYQQKNTYSVSTTTLIFSEAPPPTSTIEVMYF